MLLAWLASDNHFKMCCGARHLWEWISLLVPVTSHGFLFCGPFSIKVKPVTLDGTSSLL